jgi:pimeloyl-ACP methyl ester carboxylesterase|tara:strand:- start:20274 stop:21140 length:867 start_codon:yes stop_codon:yes gene_type:complete
MDGKPVVKELLQKVGDVEIYCELRGSGPAVVLLPTGHSDCESFRVVADALSEEFTVLSCDTRGSVRCKMPSEWGPVTPEHIADDVAGLIKSLNLAPASVFGCSSSGQAALCLGLNHPDVLRNLVIHEPALTHQAPLSGPDLPGGGAFPSMMRERVKKGLEASNTGEEDPAWSFRQAVLRQDLLDKLDPKFFERVLINSKMWATKYLGTVDARVYTDEEFEKIGRVPTTFSAGVFHLAVIAEATRAAAEKCNADFVWLPCMHFPQISIPDEFAEFVRNEIRKNLKTNHN